MTEYRYNKLVIIIYYAQSFIKRNTNQSSNAKLKFKDFFFFNSAGRYETDPSETDTINK